MHAARGMEWNAARSTRNIQITIESKCTLLMVTATRIIRYVKLICVDVQCSPSPVAGSLYYVFNEPFARKCETSSFPADSMPCDVPLLQQTAHIDFIF